jgi:hypothetical protein
MGCLMPASTGAFMQNFLCGTYSNNLLLRFAKGAIFCSLGEEKLICNGNIFPYSEAVHDILLSASSYW